MIELQKIKRNRALLILEQCAYEEFKDVDLIVIAQRDSYTFHPAEVLKEDEDVKEDTNEH